MRQFIVIALLAASANCHAMDVWDISIWDGLQRVQQERRDLMERQMQEQMRQSPLFRRR
ncbi:hypothetical protein [Herbaspirillum sp. alder98]|uniref:hypothetical protein n=1 Tax=Herbaspirillum sp. alder98 TaxID=2913096 RepID=UPI001CD855D8|nr:hypothetical protein [Herbaspirillum sp. alder98]MCA1326279.1 hypothetical protein [Herbaspirillum sp. alder98]